MNLTGHPPSADAAEEANLGSNERRPQEVLAALVAEVQDYAILMLDAEGRVATWNTGAQRIKGYRAQEIIGQRFSVFYPPEDVTAGKPQRELETAAANGRLEDEGWRVRKDGSRFWANVVITAVRDPGGVLLGYGKITRDLTERRAHELELRASEENLRNVAAVARQLPSHENPRQAICAAATGIADADIVQLWEPDGNDHLRITAATGSELSFDLRLPLAGEITATAIAYHRGKPGVLLDLHAPGAPVAVGLRDQLGVASALYEPVIGRDGPLGVLVVMWKTAVAHTSTQVVDAVGLLATEAAAAIERADLTARLNAQTQAERLRLRQLLEGAPDAIIISDSAGVIHTVNDQTLHLLGYTREELIGGSVDQLVPAGQRAGHAPHRAAFSAWPSARPMGVERELTARHKDGREIAVEITLGPVQTDEGLRVMAAVRDITDRRAAEARLRAAEEQFRRAFDDAPIGMMIVGLDGRYLQINDAFCAIVGYPREALIGLPRQSITHPDDVAQDDQATLDLLTGKAHTFVSDERYIHATGHPVWTSISVALIRDAEDRPHHFIIQAQDITDRRQYEIQLRHLADHDPLTGLLNRRSLERELASHVARVKRSGAVGAVLMIDLDTFKYYNDTQGHGAADALIVRIGQALQARLREIDVLVRLGGDEFAALLPNENRESAAVVAQDLLELVRREAPDLIDDDARPITASIGIACFSDGDHLTAEQIMINADRAMYKAKQNGRNRYAQYSTDEHERPAARAS